MADDHEIRVSGSCTVEWMPVECLCMYSIKLTPEQAEQFEKYEAEHPEEFDGDVWIGPPGNRVEGYEDD